MTHSQSNVKDEVCHKQKIWPIQVKMMRFSGKRPDLVLLYLRWPCVNPFITTQYVKSDGFQLLLDRHEM